MAEKKEEKKIEIEKFEKREFRYQNDVTFEFDIDVSKPETALAEIADFIDLMKVATKDLETLKVEFAKQIEKPAEKKPEGTGSGAPVEASTTGKQL